MTWRRLVVTLALVGATVSALPGTAAATPGDELWATRYGFLDWDAARAITVSPDGAKVFVTGLSTDGVGGYGCVGTAAYDAVSGEELWTIRYNIPGRGGAGEDIQTSPDGSSVFVTGYIGGAHGYDYATVSYDASTGAELWVRRYNGPTDGHDVARALGVSPDGSTVFVTGASSRGYVTLAYEASSGTKLWTRRYRGSSGASDLRVSPDGTAVFVTGTSDRGASSKRDYATVAYEPSTGAELWVSRYRGPGDRGDYASAVGVSPDGSTVFVTGQSPAGSRSRVDYATVAYNASTGAELWVSRYNGPASRGDYAYALAVSPDGAEVFVTGRSATTLSRGHDYTTVAYDALTGAQSWVRRYAGFKAWDYSDAARAVVVSPDGSQVFVTGTSVGWTGSPNYFTFAYDTMNGSRLWTRRYRGPNDSERANDIAVSPDGSRIFVTGASPRSDSGMDYLTVAYATT